MTTEQKDIIINMFQVGIACGLNNPIEWYVNYERSLIHFEYSKLEENSKKGRDAFIAFMRGTDSYPQDPIKDLDEEGLELLIEQYYRR